MQEIKKKLDINSKNYLQVLEIIKAKGKEARIIGGAVRDSILGYTSYDVDINTSMVPSEVIETFGSLGYKVVPTGIKFGTVSLLCKGEIFEITTLRKDLVCDGRRAKVEYTNDFYLDALRRDFTINALSYDPFKEVVYDYFEGLEDLANGVIKFIGDPQSRIKEDHLRILRFFRFFGRFGKEIDKGTLNACIDDKNLLKSLSKERIKSEFDLILTLPNYLTVLELMNKSSILPEIFPLKNDSFIEANFVNAEKIATKFETVLDRETKYALLFAGTILSVESLLALKFSRIEAKKICFFLVLLNQKNIDEYFLKKLWLEHTDFLQDFIFISVMLPKEGECENIFLKLRNMQKPVFPVNGNDMVMLGFSGNDVGLKLANLKKLWIDSNFQLTKYDLIKLTSDEHDQ